MMDTLMSETCWAHKKWNKIASDIKMVFYSSRVTKFRPGKNQVHNTVSCIPVLHGQYFVQFRWTTSMNWINLELWFVAFPKPVPSLVVCSHPFFMGLGRLVRTPYATADVHATTFEFAASFCDMLHSQYFTTIYSYKVEVNFDGKTRFGHENRLILWTS